MGFKYISGERIQKKKKCMACVKRVGALPLGEVSSVCRIVNERKCKWGPNSKKLEWLLYKSPKWILYHEEESMQYWCIYAMWTFQYSGGRHTFIIEHVLDNSHFSTLWIVSKTEKGTCLLRPYTLF